MIITEQKRKRINIYLSYNKDYYNNNHYTIGIFSCPCCVRPGGRVLGGHGELVKIFTTWQLLECW